MGDFTEAQTYVAQQRDVLPEENASHALFKLALVTYFGNKESSAKSYVDKLAPNMVDAVGNFKEELIPTKVGAILGICNFKQGYIRQALAIFLKISPQSLEEINDVSDLEFLQLL